MYNFFLDHTGEQQIMSACAPLSSVIEEIRTHIQKFIGEIRLHFTEVNELKEDIAKREESHTMIDIDSIDWAKWLFTRKEEQAIQESELKYMDSTSLCHMAYSYNHRLGDIVRSANAQGFLGLFNEWWTCEFFTAMDSINRVLYCFEKQEQQWTTQQGTCFQETKLIFTSFCDSISEVIMMREELYSKEEMDKWRGKVIQLMNAICHDCFNGTGEYDQLNIRTREITTHDVDIKRHVDMLVNIICCNMGHSEDHPMISQKKMQWSLQMETLLELGKTFYNIEQNCLQLQQQTLSIMDAFHEKIQKELWPLEKVGINLFDCTHPHP